MSVRVTKMIERRSIVCRLQCDSKFDTQRWICGLRNCHDGGTIHLDGASRDGREWLDHVSDLVRSFSPPLLFHLVGEGDDDDAIPNDVLRVEPLWDDDGKKVATSCHIHVRSARGVCMRGHPVAHLEAWQRMDSVNLGQVANVSAKSQYCDAVNYGSDWEGMLEQRTVEKKLVNGRVPRKHIEKHIRQYLPNLLSFSSGICQMVFGVSDDREEASKCKGLLISDLDLEQLRVSTVERLHNLFPMPQNVTAVFEIHPVQNSPFKAASSDLRRVSWECNPQSEADMVKDVINLSKGLCWFTPGIPATGSEPAVVECVLFANSADKLEKKFKKCRFSYHPLALESLPPLRVVVLNVTCVFEDRACSNTALVFRDDILGEIRDDLSPSFRPLFPYETWYRLHRASLLISLAHFISRDDLPHPVFCFNALPGHAASFCNISARRLRIALPMDGAPEWHTRIQESCDCVAIILNLCGAESLPLGLDSVFSGIKATHSRVKFVIYIVGISDVTAHALSFCKHEDICCRIASAEIYMESSIDSVSVFSRDVPVPAEFHRYFKVVTIADMATSADESPLDYIRGARSASWYEAAIGFGSPTHRGLSSPVASRQIMRRVYDLLMSRLTQRRLDCCILVVEATESIAGLTTVVRAAITGIVQADRGFVVELSCKLTDISTPAERQTFDIAIGRLISDFKSSSKRHLPIVFFLKDGDVDDSARRLQRMMMDSALHGVVLCCAVNSVKGLVTPFPADVNEWKSFGNAWLPYFDEDVRREAIKTHIAHGVAVLARSYPTREELCDVHLASLSMTAALGQFVPVARLVREFKRKISATMWKTLCVGAFLSVFTGPHSLSMDAWSSSNAKQRAVSELQKQAFRCPDDGCSVDLDVKNVCALLQSSEKALWHCGFAMAILDLEGIAVVQKGSNLCFETPQALKVSGELVKEVCAQLPLVQALRDIFVDRQISTDPFTSFVVAGRNTDLPATVRMLQGLSSWVKLIDLQLASHLIHEIAKLYRKNNDFVSAFEKAKESKELWDASATPRNVFAMYYRSLFDLHVRSVPKNNSVHKVCVALDWICTELTVQTPGTDLVLLQQLAHHFKRAVVKQGAQEIEEIKKCLDVLGPLLSPEPPKKAERLLGPSIDRLNDAWLRFRPQR